MINIITSNDIYSQIIRNFIYGGFIIVSTSYIITFTNHVLGSML